VLRNIRDKNLYNSGTHCGEYFLKIVLDLIVKEWPHLNPEKCSELLAFSVLPSIMDQNHLKKYLETQQKRILKNDEL
jgi:hypothetical protein